MNHVVKELQNSHRNKDMITEAQRTRVGESMELYHWKFMTFVKCGVESGRIRCEVGRME